MAAEEFEKTVQVSAGVSKLDESLQELDDVVEQYGRTAEQYDQGDLDREDVRETVDQVAETFEAVFEDQDWLGESTADIIGKDIEGQYEKFIGYQGLVRAADQVQTEEEDKLSARRPQINDSPVREEADELIDTWNRFLDTYSDAVEAEAVLREVSAEEGAQEEGLDPYAFETAFMALEDEYDRISDLQEFVDSSYR